MNERVNDFEKYILNVARCIPNFGHECAWNPDHEFKGFVKSTLKTSGYDLVEFGYD